MEPIVEANHQEEENDSRTHKLDPNIIVELDNVSKTFDRSTWAIRKASLRIKKGDCIALIGSNSAGKSTLGRLIANVIKQTSGTIDYYFHDENIFNAIGYQAERQNWPNGFRVSDVTKLWINIYNVQDHEWIAYLWDVFEIESLKNRFLSKLSVVSLQLFAIFLALLHRPELLVIDNFSSAIDLKRKTKILKLFQDYLEDDKTIVLVYPDDYILDNLATRVVYLHNGKIVDDLTSKKIKDNYGSIFNYIRTISTNEEQKDSERQPDPFFAPILKTYQKLLLELNDDYKDFFEDKIPPEYHDFDIKLKNAIFAVNDLEEKFKEIFVADLNQETVAKIRKNSKKSIKIVKQILKTISRLNKSHTPLTHLAKLERDFSKILFFLEEKLKEIFKADKLVINGETIDFETTKNDKKELEVLKERYIKEELKIIRLERRKVSSTKDGFDFLSWKWIKRLSPKERAIIEKEVKSDELERKIAVLDSHGKMVVKEEKQVSQRDIALYDLKITRSTHEDVSEAPSTTQKFDSSSDIYYHHEKSEPTIHHSTSNSKGNE